jgi:glutamate racemase
MTVPTTPQAYIECSLLISPSGFLAGMAAMTGLMSTSQKPPEAEKITVPIIRPAARIAARGRRVAVIATKHTVKAAAFSREIWRFNQSAFVSERAEQDLVALVEDGNRDGKLNGKTLARLWDVARWTEKIQADVLVLGCTHFPYIRDELAKLT